MTAPDEPHSGGEQFFDAALAKSLVAFGLAAVQRRKWVAMIVFGVVVVATIVAVIFLPRTYYTETKLIAQRNAVMTVRADQNWDALRGVSETVLSHDNIVAMVRQTELVKNWNARRPPINRLKDAIMSALRGPLSDEAQVQGMAYMLADRLKMSIGDGAINISIYWPEPITPRSSSRRLSRISSKRDTTPRFRVSSSSSRSTRRTAPSSSRGSGPRPSRSRQRATEDRSVRCRASQRRFVRRFVRRAGRPSPPRTAAPDHRTHVPDAAFGELKAQYEEKKKKLKDMEDERRRKRLDAQNLLGELKGKFTEEYPEVRRQQAKVVTLSEATAEEKALSGEVDDLEEQLSTAASRPWRAPRHQRREAMAQREQEREAVPRQPIQSLPKFGACSKTARTIRIRSSGPSFNRSPTSTLRFSTRSSESGASSTRRKRRSSTATASSNPSRYRTSPSSRNSGGGRGGHHRRPRARPPRRRSRPRFSGSHSRQVAGRTTEAPRSRRAGIPFDSTRIADSGKLSSRCPPHRRRDPFYKQIGGGS